MTTEPNRSDRTAVLTWDWREQPDLDHLGRLICDLSGGTVHLHQVDTGSDQYAIVLATTKLDARSVCEIYDREPCDGDEE